MIRPRAHALWAAAPLRLARTPGWAGLLLVAATLLVASVVAPPLFVETARSSAFRSGLAVAAGSPTAPTRQTCASPGTAPCAPTTSGRCWRACADWRRTARRGSPPPGWDSRASPAPSSSSEDDDHVAQVVGVLAAAARSGSAVLVATHDARVWEVAHRVVRLEDGRVRA